MVMTTTFWCKNKHTGSAVVKRNDQGIYILPRYCDPCQEKIFETKYPEHYKINQSLDKMNEARDLLEWLVHDKAIKYNASITTLINEYFKIDEDKLNSEILEMSNDQDV